MKCFLKKLGCFVASAFLFAGCKTENQTAVSPVRLGMLREDLKARFGEPVRILSAGQGEEYWFYRFVSYRSQPTGSSETSHDFGQQTSSVTVGWEFSKETEVRPIHVSAEGQVIEPLPEGKVVKN